jgi:hypothetical protein
MSKPKENGRYSRVSRRMWNDEKFRELSAPPPNAQSLFQRLLTGPELTNIPGCIPALDAGMARALRWPLEGFLEAFDEVQAQGMAEADWDAGLIWVPNAIKHNEPESPNVVLSWTTAWEELPECDLKIEAWGHLHAWLKTKGESWVAAFEKACRKPSRKPSRKGPPLLGPKPDDGSSAPFPESEAGSVTETVTGSDPSDRRAGLDAGAESTDGGTEDPETAPEPELVLTPAEPSKAEKLRADARWVFECWKLDTGHPRAVFDAKRESRIKGRLREGFTREQLRDAIVNRHNSIHLMGLESGVIYDGIETLLRDAAQVERLLNLTAPERPRGSARGGLRGPVQNCHGKTGTENARATLTENLEDDFSDLRRIALAAQARARAAGIPIGNLGAIKPRMTAQDFLAALPVSVDADVAESDRIDRNVEARAVRGMLPEFLRAPSASALVSRVAETDFLAVVNDWTWGCGNLLLLGPTGSGRSTAAACLFRRLLAMGVRDGGEAWENARFMAWFHAGDLAEARREHALGKGEAPEIGRAGRARLLVLDDAGWEQDPFVCSMILKERYELGVPTIITSGKTEEELIRHYGAAVVRRMTETGGSLPGGGIMSRFPSAGEQSA